MAHWLLKEYHASVDVLLAPFKESDALNDSEQQQYDYPSLFNFYNYLHTHPLIRRCHLVQHKSQADCMRPSLSSQSSTVVTSAEETHKYERALYFRTACIHLNSGLPDIALEILSMLPTHNTEHGYNDTVNSSTSNLTNLSTTDMIVTGTLTDNNHASKILEDYPAKEQYPSLINTGGWGAASNDDFSMKTNRFADLDDEYKIGFSLSDDDDDEKEEDSEGVNKDENGMEAVTNGDVKAEDAIDKTDEASSVKDVAALNLKYRCIIQLLIEGLKVLPVKCTQEKLRLRSTLKRVLQEELDFLHALCDYESINNNESSASTSNTSMMEDNKATMDGMCFLFFSISLFCTYFYSPLQL